MNADEAQVAKLGSLGQILTGRTPPASRPELFGEIYPFITPSDIDGESRHVRTGRYLSALGAQAFERIALPRGAICVVCIGATIGKVCMTSEPSFMNQQINAIVVDTSRHDPAYVFHVVRLLKDELRARAGGAATPIINKSAFSEVEILVPSFSTQHRIAAILSAYDDLIENCERRIRVLDEMTRALYREWFVSFRYPGHEKAPFIESALGRIPKGWSTASLGQVTTKIGSGATPRGGKGAYRREGTALIRSLNIYDYRFEHEDLAHIDEAQSNQLSNVVVEPCDVLLNITGASVARCAMVPSYVLPARVNQHVAIVRANRQVADPYWLLDTVNFEGNKSRLLAQAQGGATREALTKDTLSRFLVVLPPVDLVQQYARFAEKTHALRESLSQRAHLLRTTRDLVLPRLLSGQLPTREAA